MRTSDDIVARLGRYGEVSICLFEKGWWAKLTISGAPGSKMEFKSDFRHPTMLSALTQLEARVGDAREKLADTLLVR